MEEGRSEREGKLSRDGRGGLRKRGNQVEVEEGNDEEVKYSGGARGGREDWGRNKINEL